MIEIMEEIQKLVPSTGAHSGQDSTTCGGEFIVPCLFGHDQLTCECACNSQHHWKDAATASERLEGLVSTTEDWHAKMNMRGKSLCITASLTCSWAPPNYKVCQSPLRHFLQCINHHLPGWVTLFPHLFLQHFPSPAGCVRVILFNLLDLCHAKTKEHS